jgi:hypothetical protein
MAVLATGGVAMADGGGPGSGVPEIGVGAIAPALAVLIGGLLMLGGSRGKK